MFKYESVFVKHIIETANSNDKNKLNGIFKFIESLLLYGDDKIKNLVGER